MGDNNDEGGFGGDAVCTNDFDCNIEAGELCNAITQGCEVPSTVECNEDFVCTFMEFNSDCLEKDCWGCGDNYCSPDENIPGDNYCEEDCQTEEEVVCGNFECETGENDPFSNSYCSSDCQTNSLDDGRNEAQCGDGICERLEGEDEDSCSLDCESLDEGESLWWLWLIIIILVLGGGAFFVITKMKKGGGGTPSYLQRPPITSIPSQSYNPPTKRRAPRDEALESELDRSIKEAQDLLKRKK